MTEQTLNVALVQHPCGEDPGANMQASMDGIHEAHALGAQLVLLQELHRTPYFCQSEDPSRFSLAEPIPGPGTGTLAALARELGIVIVATLFERRAGGLYHNTAVVLDSDGGIAGTYRKMHIPDDPGYHEKYYFTPGDQGFLPIPTSIGKLGVLICWDQWFPEAARLMALAGADLLLFPTAIGWDPGDDETERQHQRDAWITIQRGHAIANGLPVLACNRTGMEPAPGAGAGGIEFWGSGFVCDPQGAILARAPVCGSSVTLAEVDPGHSESIRQHWPFLRDRRIDAYAGLERRYLDDTARRRPD